MILYIFIDGVGYGSDDPETNPFAKYAKGFFLPLADRSGKKKGQWQHASYIETDASMGVSGLPQSATGQTAIWTGIPAPNILNRHISGFPTYTLKKVIKEYSILKILKEHGYRCSFLNCYSEQYKEFIKTHPRHLSASTLVQMASEQALKTLEDLREGRGLYMDITHEYIKKFAGKHLEADDPILQARDPYEQGKLAVQIAREYDLSIYEFFFTDKIGHSQNWKNAAKVIETVETFMEGVVDTLVIDKEQLIVTSDHGNLEDLSVGTHTKNKVPTFLLGQYSSFFAKRIHTLADITPSIYELFSIAIELDSEQFIPKAEV